MSSRRLAILVGIAVVAGVGVAAYGLATRGSSKSAPVLQIDEVNGRVGRVVLGETGENVIAVLGKPRLAKDLPSPDYVQTGFLVYAHLLISLRKDRVVSIQTKDRAAQTEKVVKIGDPLSAVRASYRKAATCIPNAADKNDPHPRCAVKVPAGRLLVRGDPIRVITLTRTR
jgi:hypothetical protein